MDESTREELDNAWVEFLKREALSNGVDNAYEGEQAQTKDISHETNVEPVASMGAGPMGAGPMETQPMGTGPMGTGPMGTGPMGTGPMETQPVGAGPVGAQSTKTGPVVTQSTGTGPVGAGTEAQAGSVRSASSKSTKGTRSARNSKNNRNVKNKNSGNINKTNKTSTSNARTKKSANAAGSVASKVADSQATNEKSNVNVNQVNKASEKPKKEKSRQEALADAKKDEMIAELREKVVRNMAEFDNFRKRTEKEKTAMFEIGAKSIVEKILPVIDNFERGLSAISEEEKEGAFAQGIDMIYKQLIQTLESAGVKKIDAVGKEFDPNLHNAVMHIEDESMGENLITEEFQKGYMYRDAVIRHSLVKVVN